MFEPAAERLRLLGYWSTSAHAPPSDFALADSLMADLAEEYAHGELRISHEQNVILPHVHKSDLPALHRVLKAAAAAVPVGSPNACAEWIEECGGVDTIEQLQQHENDAVYELALGIVEEFFSEEEEEVADMAPQATSSGFAFAAPTQHTQFAL